MKIVTTDIFEFEKEFLEFIIKIQGECNLQEAISHSKIDLEKTGAPETLNYLVDIERNLKI